MEYSLNCDIIWSAVPFKRKQEGFEGEIAHDFPERPNVVLPTMCATVPPLLMQYMNMILFHILTFEQFPPSKICVCLLCQNMHFKSLVFDHLSLYIQKHLSQSVAVCGTTWRKDNKNKFNPALLFIDMVGKVLYGVVKSSRLKCSSQI